MVWLFVPDLLRFQINLCSVFSPNQVDREQYFAFSPPIPINKFYYRCDKKFHLDDLLKLYETCDNYAIVLISGCCAYFYTYNINQIKLIKTIDVSLPNQHKTGGFSAARFGRIRDEKIGLWTKKIIDLMIQFYINEGIFKYRGIILAGPSIMKDMVKSLDAFQKIFMPYLLKTVTINEITSQSIHQVINLAADVLTATDDLVEKFNSLLADPSKIDLIVFGTQEVIEYFNNGQLQEIYVSAEYTNRSSIAIAFRGILSNTKTQIHIIKSREFVTKYGELVGIKYYITDWTAECSDRITECSDRITECSDRITECSDRITECSDRTAECSDRTAECSDRTAECSDRTET